MGCINIKKVFFLKNIIKKTKKNKLQPWSIYKTCTTQNALEPRLYKEFLQLSNKNTNNSK